MRHARTFPLAESRPRHRPARVATGIDPNTIASDNSVLHNQLQSPRFRRAIPRSTDENEPITGPLDLGVHGQADDQPLLEDGFAMELRPLQGERSAQQSVQIPASPRYGDMGFDAEDPYTYEAIDTPPGFQPLDFRPAILKREVTIGLAVFYAAIIAVMVALMFMGDDNQSYSVLDLNIYLGARYGPSVVGTITAVLVRSTLQELCRMLPYLRMSDPKPGVVGQGRARETIAAYYFPTFGTITLTAKIVLLLRLLTAPLTSVKLGFLQIVPAAGGWTVIVHRGIGYALIAYYVVQIVVLIVITVRLWSRQTGLRTDWDPTNIADVVALLQYFNLDVGKIPGSILTLRLAEALDVHDFRLGYWRRQKGGDPGSAQVIYGIRAFEHSRSHHQRMQNRVQWRWEIERRWEAEHTPSPYRGLPILAYNGINRMIYWVLGTGLTILFLALAVTKVSKRVFMIQPPAQFQWADPAVRFDDIATINTTSSGEFWFFQGTSSEYVRLAGWTVTLRSLPMFPATVAINLSIDFNRYHLYAQPLTDMYKGPSSAEETILLDYQTAASFGVLLRSWDLGHRKVFYFALLNLLAPLVALAPVGMSALSIKDEVIYGQMNTGLVVTTVAVLAIYLSSYVFAILSANRRFPRAGTSLIDTWMMCYSSRLARYPEFRDCGPTWTKADLAASLQLRHDKYLLGICTGIDGKDRVGFDVATIERREQATRAVTFVAPRSRAKGHCHLCVEDESYHEKTEVAEKEALLSHHHKEYVEPIKLPRPFEKEGQDDQNEDEAH